MLYLIHYLFTGNFVNYHLIALNIIGVYVFYTIIENLIGKKKFITSYLQFFNVLCIITSIGFLLIALNIIEPVSEFKNPDGRTNYNFIFTFSNTFIPQINFARVGSYFDEPGTFAYMIMLNLCLNKLTIDDKKTEWIHIFGGFFTFSLAHFATLIMYLILYYGYKSSIKIIKYSIPVVGILIFVYLYQPDLFSIIERYTIGRVQYDEKQLISGSKRLILTQIAYDAFTEKPILGHGIVPSDPSSKYYNTYMGANFFQPFAYHGVIGFMILFLHFFYFMYLSFKRFVKTIKISFIAPWILIFINFFQRPTIFGGVTVYLLFILFISILQKK
jgi:hypothetical protein